MNQSKYPMKVEMETSDGMAEAIKGTQNDYWVIDYPWGGDKFYGTVTQVKSRMKKHIMENNHDKRRRTI